jgi:hypothetical protein
MKIIRQGADPKQTPLRGECTRCRTVIEFHPTEAKFVPDQRDGDFYQIACPTCSATITTSAPSGYDGPG